MEYTYLSREIKLREHIKLLEEKIRDMKTAMNKAITNIQNREKLEETIETLKFLVECM